MPWKTILGLVFVMSIVGLALFLIIKGIGDMPEPEEEMMS